MFGNKRKTIGVFISELVNFYQSQLYTAVTKAGKELNYNVAVFSCFSIQNEDVMEGEMRILELPDYESMDGIILALDTMGNHEMRRRIVEKIKKKCHCPVVSVREETEEFYNVLVDDRESMKEIIRHFTDYHQFTDICFLAGPKGHIDSERRLKCFCDIMAEKKLQVNEQQIYHGNFWKYDGGPACRQFIDERGKLPEAIICANDYMAISVCNELISRGISIPEDIAVCGFDNIWESTVCAPTLSTVSVPVREMGRKAVEIIAAINEGKEVSKNVYLPVEVVLRESCGCIHPKKEDLLKSRKIFYKTYDRQREYQFQSTFLAIDLEEIDELRQLTEVLGGYSKALKGMKQQHICLKTNMEDFQDVVNQVYTDEMFRCISLKKSGERDDNVFRFPTKELLPGEILDDEPQGYIFMPIHYREKSFGYTAICFEDDECGDSFYRTWMCHLSNALWDMMVQKESRNLYQSLKSSYVRDALTKIYNRRGFMRYADELMEKAKKENKYFFVIAADLDRLKYINDTYGHAEGDKMIVSMANALTEAAGENTICARMGGDEFDVAGVCDREEEAYEYLERFEKKRKDYGVHVSHGIVITDLEENNGLEYYMNLSDYYMYKNKIAKKSGGSYA